MNIRVAVVILGLMVCTPLDAAVSIQTIGEIRGLITRYESNNVSAVDYKMQLEAYISGLTQGFRLAHQGGTKAPNRPMLACSYVKADYLLRLALEPDDTKLGLLLSEFVWDTLRARCGK